MLKLESLADPWGVRDARDQDPLNPNFFIFIQFLREIDQNNRLGDPSSGKSCIRH